MLKKFSIPGLSLLLLLIALDILVWYRILFAPHLSSATLHFLDVGQGDATLLHAPGGVQVLTDAGPDASVLRALQEALAKGDRYIDIGIISHPELDHFNGFNYLLGRFEFGAFVINGRTDARAEKEWQAFYKTAKKERVPLLTLGQGDRIRFGDTRIVFLSPDAGWRESGKVNDTGLVERIETPSWKALLAADIGENVEEELAEEFDLDVEIFKVGHHGSKYSSSFAFVKEVSPLVAVISAGEGNRYGHPTREALERLYASGAEVFRTDTQGTIKIVADGERLKVFGDREE